MSEAAQPSDAAAKLQQFLDNTFSYHKPFGDQPSRYERIRAKAKELALVILGSTPAGSREQGIALDSLRASVMWANASIACNEVDPGPIPAEAGDPVPSVAPSSQPIPAPESAAPAEAPAPAAEPAPSEAPAPAA